MFLLLLQSTPGRPRSHNLKTEPIFFRSCLGEQLNDLADFAAESLRLTTLRYQASDAIAFEIVDAESALASARNGFDDGQACYWIGLAILQTLTGRF